MNVCNDYSSLWYHQSQEVDWDQMIDDFHIYSTVLTPKTQEIFWKRKKIVRTEYEIFSFTCDREATPKKS